MIEIIDPDSVIASPAIVKISAGWHYPLDYTWVINNLRDFITPGGDVILDVGSLFSELSLTLEKGGYKIKTLDRTPDGLHDYKGDFLDIDFQDDLFDCVMWVSSIEHQETLGDYGRCIQKSMDLLKPGGLFMATFPIVPVGTVYYTPAEQWNLSIRDAMRMFDCDVVRGDYNKIWERYRQNRQQLRDRYVKRFHKWDYGSPDYLAAGVIKIKD